VKNASPKREPADRGFDTAAEPHLVPGKLLQADDVAAPEDFVEQLQRRDARVRSGVAAPAIDQGRQDPCALKTQALLQVELGLRRLAPASWAMRRSPPERFNTASSAPVSET